VGKKLFSSIQNPKLTIQNPCTPLFNPKTRLDAGSAKPKQQTVSIPVKVYH
jgi:hypothetical protein